MSTIGYKQRVNVLAELRLTFCESSFARCQNQSLSLRNRQRDMATKQKRITFKLLDIEYERIQALSERTGRTKTDIQR